MEFPISGFKTKKDSYAKSRGPSKLLYIACATCHEPAFVYQKDGSGRLLRMYADRILWPPELVEEQKTVTAGNVRQAGVLACRSCANTIGIPMVYEPESRPAYRVQPGTIQAFRSPEQAQARLGDQ